MAVKEVEEDARVGGQAYRRLNALVAPPDCREMHEAVLNIFATYRDTNTDLSKALRTGNRTQIRMKHDALLAKNQAAWKRWKTVSQKTAVWVEQQRAKQGAETARR